MKNSLILLITLPFLSACEEPGKQTTELEGVWLTGCIEPFSAFTSSTDQNSHTVSMSFKSNNIETHLNTYTDNQCVVLESTAPASEPNNIFTSNTVAVSFSIGESITAGNGLPAKEIDLTQNDGEIYLSIYQLQDDGNSLYFGGPCVQQQPQNIPILGGLTNCVNGRSIDISFSLKYVKQ